MVMALASYSLLSYRINTGIPSSYKRVNVSGITTMGSTASEMSKYEQGIVAQGNDYATDVLHIDLSDYAKNNGPHKVDLQDGTPGHDFLPYRNVECGGLKRTGRGDLAERLLVGVRV